MARNTSVNLGDHFERFVDEKVASGSHASVSEVLRSSLRLFEDQEMKKQYLRDLLLEGEKSGTITDSQYNSMFKKHRNSQLGSKDS